MTSPFRPLHALLLALLAGTALAQQPPAQDTGSRRPGDLTAVLAEGTTDPFEIQRLAGHLFGRHGPPIIENAAESFRIRYVTTGLDGELTEVWAQLFVPVLDSPHQRPLYAFGSGTTGLHDTCAPTRESAYPNPLGEYRPYLLAYAGRGFTAVIPDYLGFEDEERYQSYFNAEAEARVMLDAVRAVEEFYESRGAPAGTERSVFLGGYSQGGHAAFAAADHREAYAPDVEIAGLLGFGATTDVESLLREGPFYAPYIVLSYSQDFGDERFPANRILAPHWLPGLREAAGRLCVDRAQAHYPFDGAKVYSDEFAKALYSHRLETDFPRIAQTLRENRTGLSGHGVPAMIVQGEDDVIVWNETQERFVRQLCAAGSAVHYVSYPDVRHRETRPVAFEESIAWMRSIDGMQPPPSSCRLLAGAEDSLP